MSSESNNRETNALTRLLHSLSDRQLDLLTDWLGAEPDPGFTRMEIVKQQQHRRAAREAERLETTSKYDVAC